MPILLKIAKGAGEGQILTVPDGQTRTLGRGGASFLIADPLLSREHCAIRCAADGCVVTDLKSMNGTFLNGKRMSETRLLVAGDRLRIGSVVFEVVEATAPAAPAVGLATTVVPAPPVEASPLAPPTAPEEGEPLVPLTIIVPPPAPPPPPPPVAPVAPVAPVSAWPAEEPAAEAFPHTVFIASPPAFPPLPGAPPPPPAPPAVPATPAVADEDVVVQRTIDVPPPPGAVLPPPPPPPPARRAALPPLPPLPSPPPRPVPEAARTCEACGRPLAPDEERTMCPSCFDRYDVKEDLLEGFRILERVFRTPTGTVYKAEQPLLGRTVLLKTITTQGWEQDEKTIRRFLREAKAAARFTHPSIVEFYDVNEQGEHLFIVMEHVDGPTLEQIVEGHGPLEPKRAARYMAQIADGLAFVHAQHVVHRDVRPGTILVGQAADRAKLADFTLARNVDIAAFGEITATGDTLAGIPYFEAPEQVRDSKRADARSDIYSYGATFFFALSGRRPIGGSNYIEFLSRLAVESAPPLASVAPGIPEEIAALIDRCLRRNPEERYASMDQVRDQAVEIAQVLGIEDTTFKRAGDA